jgi:hypothetical protein
MSKHTIKGYLYYVHYDFQEPGEFQIAFHQSATMSGPEWTVIREHSFEIDLPDDFDPRALQIAALEAEKQKVRAEFAARITEIDRQISKLQALECAA